ncbi:MAG: T9SS type A sorting domain-containing protein [Candidatus Marinimicrobia bacterium]|nr:T9SS type A sorting domain-containing protein [Candidatus Neomarinimicrobiota bacterium]
MTPDCNIGSAYPNPFNPVTIVPLNLAKDAVVSATLYDIAGHPVRELHKGIITAGSHDLKIKGANLSTGIYFVHIIVNDAVNVKKIVLMK